MSCLQDAIEFFDVFVEVFVKKVKSKYFKIDNKV